MTSKFIIWPHIRTESLATLEKIKRHISNYRATNKKKKGRAGAAGPKKSCETPLDSQLFISGASPRLFWPHYCTYSWQTLAPNTLTHLLLPAIISGLPFPLRRPRFCSAPFIDDNPRRIREKKQLHGFNSGEVSKVPSCNSGYSKVNWRCRQSKHLHIRISTCSRTWSIWITKVASLFPHSTLTTPNSKALASFPR